MRKKLTVVLMTVMMLAMSTAPAMSAADGGGQDGFKDPQPVYPPGHFRGEADRPDQAANPTTGKLNKYYHGNCQADSCLQPPSW